MPTCIHCHDYLKEGRFCNNVKKDCKADYLEEKITKAKEKVRKNNAPPKYIKIGKGTMLELPNHFSKKQMKEAVERFKEAQI